jgi:hypothetical protein
MPGPAAAARPACRRYCTKSMPNRHGLVWRSCVVRVWRCFFLPRAGTGKTLVRMRQQQGHTPAIKVKRGSCHADLSFCAVEADQRFIGFLHRRSVQDRPPHDGGQYGARRDGNLRVEAVRSSLHRRPDRYLPAYRYRRGGTRAAQRPGRQADQPRLGGPDRAGRFRPPAQTSEGPGKPGPPVPLDRSDPWHSADVASRLAASGKERQGSRRAPARLGDLGHARRPLWPLPRSREHALGSGLYRRRGGFRPESGVRAGGRSGLACAKRFTSA